MEDKLFDAMNPRVTRPKDLVFEAFKHEYNPIDEKYFIYANLISMYADMEEDCGSAEYSVFVFERFNPMKCTANSKLYISYLVYYDTVKEVPIMVSIQTDKDISRIFTNAFEDAELALAQYNSMLMDSDEYDYWLKEMRVQEDDEAEEEYDKSTAISFFNNCYAVSIQDNETVFHLWISEYGNEEGYATISSPVLSPDDDTADTVFWVREDFCTGRLDILDICVDKDLKNIMCSAIWNIFRSYNEALDYAERHKKYLASEDICLGEITEVNESNTSYEISFTKDGKTANEINDISSLRFDKPKRWIDPTVFNEVVFGKDILTSAYKYFIALGNKKENIISITTRTPIEFKFDNIFSSNEDAEKYYLKAKEKEVLIKPVERTFVGAVSYDWVPGQSNFIHGLTGIDTIRGSDKYFDRSKAIYVAILDSMEAIGYKTSVVYVYDDFYLDKYENVFSTKKETVLYILEKLSKAK